MKDLQNIQSLSEEERRLVGYNADEFVDENFSGHSYVKEIILTLFANKATAISLICLIAGVAYPPVMFIAIIMGFLCLTVSVVASVMDAAVALREENDLTI